MSTNDDAYPCEVTGGAFGVDNDYIDGEYDFHNQEINERRYYDISGKLRDRANLELWRTDMYVIGNDNQNQFCYMWTILYMICKVYSLRDSRYQWESLHKFMCDRNIIPVSFIKLFISLTTRLQYIRDNSHLHDLLTDEFFIKWFNTFTTNSLNYSFAMVINEFFQAESIMGSRVLQSDKPIKNLFDCLEQFNSILTSNNGIPLNRLRCYNENSSVTKYICDTLKGLPYMKYSALYPNLCGDRSTFIMLIADVNLRKHLSLIGIEYEKANFESRITYDGFSKFVKSS